MDVWTVVLSSAVVSAAISAAVGSWSSLRVKRKEYVNAYYMKILERRISAYEQVERLIVETKTAVTDDDRRLYHLLFHRDDETGVYALLYEVMSQALWLSDDVFDLVRQLNVLIFSGLKKEGVVEFGKKHYLEIGEWRTKLEAAHARDMLVLHNVPAFLKAKKPQNSYAPLPSSSD